MTLGAPYDDIDKFLCFSSFPVTINLVYLIHALNGHI